MDNGVDAVNDNLMYTSIYYGDFTRAPTAVAFLAPSTRYLFQVRETG